MREKFARSLFPWVKAFAPSVLWAAFIFLLSSQATLPGFDVSWTDFVFKKLAHMFVFAVLFVLIHWGISRTAAEKRKSPIQIWQLAFAITLAYAVTDELHQTLTPGRYGTFRDLGYDSLGAFIALLKLYKYI